MEHPIIEINLVSSIRLKRTLKFLKLLKNVSILCLSNKIIFTFIFRSPMNPPFPFLDETTTSKNFEHHSINFEEIGKKL